MESCFFTLAFFVFLLMQSNTTSNILRQEDAFFLTNTGDVPVNYSKLLSRLLQQNVIDREFKGLYLNLKSKPELMSRRLQASSVIPKISNQAIFGEYAPEVEKPFAMEDDSVDSLIGSYLRNVVDEMKVPLVFRGETPPITMDKRTSFILRPGHAQPACPYVTDWRLLHRAKDINDTDVEVFQPEGRAEGRQWFYTVSCNKNLLSLEDSNCPNCCRGINNRRFASQCLQKYSYVIALVRQSFQTEFDWNWIQIPSSCSCAVEERS